MKRKLSPDIYWFHEPRAKQSLTEMYDVERPDWYDPGETIYIMQNAYLIDGDETLLFDTLSPAGRELVLTHLENVLDGRDLDYLVVSHPEAPHAGNAFSILDQHPEAEFIAPGNGDLQKLYHLDEATLVDPGERIDLGGFEVEFLDPTFPDHGLHMWMREMTTDTLFCVDWLGYFCMKHERLKFLDEVDSPLTHHRLREFHGRVLFWLQYADPELVNAAIEEIIDDYAPKRIYQAHGLPIRENPIRYMRKMKAVNQHIHDGGRLGVNL